MASHSNLSDSKSPQVSRTLLSILADLNNTSCPLSKPSGTVTSAPITTGLTITVKFHGFFILRQGVSTCLALRFLFHSMVCLDGKIHCIISFFCLFFLISFFFFFFFFCKLSQGHLNGIIIIIIVVVIGGGGGNGNLLSFFA